MKADVPSSAKAKMKMTICLLALSGLFAGDCLAGYIQQDAAGDWVSHNDDGSTTYYKQGPDRSSWYSNTYPAYSYKSPVPNEPYTPKSYNSYNSNSIGSTAQSFYQIGREVGAANRARQERNQEMATQTVQAISSLLSNNQQIQYETSPEKNKLISDWYSMTGPNFRSQYSYKDWYSKLASYSMADLQGYFEDFKTNPGKYNKFLD